MTAPADVLTVLTHMRIDRAARPTRLTASDRKRVAKPAKRVLRLADVAKGVGAVVVVILSLPLLPGFGV